MFGQKLKELRDENHWSMEKFIELYNKKYDAKMNKSTLSRYENGLQSPKISTAAQIADFFGVSVEYMTGKEYNAPNISEDYVSFPVIGEIAAGFDSIGIEDWTGDTIDVPTSYLKGHKYNDFFVLSVKGDSMYPLYHNGDKVLVLKCSTLDYSGQVGAVLYDDEYTTLKKVEYKTGEDWLTLVPINPNFQPTRIENEALEHCRVIGIPKLLIREIEE